MSGNNGGNYHQIALQHLLLNMEGEIILYCGVVWGGMELESLWEVQGKMNTEQYCKILEDGMEENFEKLEMEEKEHYFQQDNDTKHTSKQAKQWFLDKNVQVLEWPAQSPDINSIELLWHHLKFQLQQYDTPPKGVHELWERVVEEWNKNLPEVCQNLIKVCLGRYKQL